MNVSKAPGTARPAVAGPGSLAPGAFDWATVYQFDDKESNRFRGVCALDSAASQSPGSSCFIYCASQAEGVRRWHVSSGASEVLVEPSAFQDPVHCLAVVARNLWVCTGNNATAGSVAIFDLDTAAPKCKPFAAHKGEITAMVAGVGGKYMVTGGVDFQVKVWGPDGTPLVTSNHHNKQVEALLLTPLTKGAGTASSGKLWTAAADASLAVWSDEAGSGLLEASKTKVVKVEGGRAIKIMVLNGSSVWCGCERGQVCVYGVEDVVLRRAFRPHQDTVDAMASVGNQVWSGSRDRSIIAHDATSHAPLFTLGDQERGAVQALSIQLREAAAQSGQQQAQLEAQLAALREQLTAAQGEVEAERVSRASDTAAAGQQLEGRDAQLRALEAELSALRDDHAKAVEERDAVQHQGEQLRGDKARLDAELEGVRGQVAALEGDKDGLGAQLKAALAAAEWVGQGEGREGEWAAAAAEAQLKGSLGEAASQAMAERDALAAALNKAQEEAAALSSSRDALEASQQALTQQLDSSQAQLLDCQQQLSGARQQLEVNSKQMASTEAELGEVRQALAQALGGLGDSGSRLQEVEAANHRLQATLRELEWVRGGSSLAAEKADSERLRSAAAEGERLRSELQGGLAKSSSEREGLAAQVSQHQGELAALRDALEAARQASGGAQQSLDHTQAQLEARGAELARLEAELRSAAELQAATQQALAAAQSGRIELEQQLARLQQQDHEVRAARDALAQAKAALEAQQAEGEVERRSLAEGQARLQQQVAELAKQLAESQASGSQSSADLAAARNQAQQAEAQLQALQQQLAGRQAEQEELARSSQELEGLRAELAGAKALVQAGEDAAQRQRIEHEAALMHLQRQVEELEAQLRGAQDSAGQVAGGRHAGSACTLMLCLHTPAILTTHSSVSSFNSGSKSGSRTGGLEAEAADLKQQVQAAQLRAQQAEEQAGRDSSQLAALREELAAAKAQVLPESIQLLASFPPSCVVQAEAGALGAELEAVRAARAAAAAAEQKAAQGQEEVAQELARIRTRLASLEAAQPPSSPLQAPSGASGTTISPNITVIAPGYAAHPLPPPIALPPSPPAPTNLAAGASAGDRAVQHQATLRALVAMQGVEGSARSLELEQALQQLASQVEVLGGQLAQAMQQVADSQASAGHQAAACEAAQGEVQALQEERYQLQLALRAAQRELELMKAAGPSPAPPAPPPSEVQLGSQRVAAQKLAALEAALKRATEDYQLLLQGASDRVRAPYPLVPHILSLTWFVPLGNTGCCALAAELRTIREEAVARDVTQRQLREERDALQRQLLSHGAREGAAAGELAMLRTEVARLERQLRDAEMRIGQLTRALSDCEAHRRRWEELEGTHSTVKQRLEAARLSDELFNRQRPTPQPPSGSRAERVRPLPPTGFG
ncbi:hypothetical protein QJQ45_014458 [Haematococcus lacustris]|nr:hypothetical protein QJQ45_014458 [Haematococcus lacustris]